MSTVRWWQRSTRMVRAAKLGLGGSVILLVGWVVGFESAVWRISGEVGIVVLLLGYLARLSGWNDLASKVLGPPSNSDDRKWWQG